MNVSRDTNRKALSILIVLVLALSYGSSTATKGATPSEIESTVRNKQSMLSAGLEHYTDEPLTGYIESWPDNATSAGVSLTGNVVGEPDGLTMEMVFLTTYEYAILKINGSIMSDSIVLRGCIDEVGSGTELWVFGWIDPYTEPDLSGLPDSVPRENWTFLGSATLTNGNVTFEYDNASIEYILIHGTSAPAGIGSFQTIDSIEVHGFTNVMADEQNDGIPDIWQYPDVEMYNVSADIDLFGYTWGVMGLVGVASVGSTDLEFLTPFIKMGVVEPGTVDETHFYVICQCELTLPWTGAEEEFLESNYMDFLDSYDLLNMTYVYSNWTLNQEVEDAFDRYMADDGRIRTYHVIDYTVDGAFDPQDYFAAQGQINAEYNTLDVKTSTPKTAQEEFDLDVSIVLDIVENVMDAVQGGKDMVTQFMSKIIGFIQGKMLDGIGKELMEKITKTALKTALKAVLSITTIKDIVVKGSKILEKLGVELPDWLRTARDFVESIPFIDPAVEIWKVRLTFVNETTGLPVLGYDYINNASIYSHPKGLYFGDTYSAQVILSSRDIFPVIERIQSVNGSRTLTGNLYVEDLGTLEATMAKSSLEPGEAARGRVYGVPPNGTLVISQCHIAAVSSLPATVELGAQFSISLSVSDENGTLLSDVSRARAAINNMPYPMIELPIVAEADGRLTLTVDTDTLGVLPGDYMVAAVYKPVAMFHDYWNFTFVLQDTVAPYIGNLNGIESADSTTVVFSAIVSDFDLNVSSVILKTIDGSDNLDFAVTHLMTSNGTHFVVSLAVSEFDTAVVYYGVEAADKSGNVAQTSLQSVAITLPFNLGILGIYIAAGVGVVAVVGILIYFVRRPGR